MGNIEHRVRALEQGNQHGIVERLAELEHRVREQELNRVAKARSQQETVPESRSHASACMPRSRFAHVESLRNGSPYEPDDSPRDELLHEAGRAAPNFRSGFNQQRQLFQEQSAPRKRQRRQRKEAGRLELARNKAAKAPRQKPCTWPGQIKDLLYQTLCKEVPANERLGTLFIGRVLVYFVNMVAYECT